MKKALILGTIIAALIIGFLVGRYDYYIDRWNKPHIYNIKEQMHYEKDYNNALLEGLHWFLEDNSVRWADEFMNTKEYKKIDSVNQGDWGDFYDPKWVK